MLLFERISSLLLPIIFLATSVISAPSDSPRDADAAQSGYVGSDHNVDPEIISRFQQLWNVTFKPDEKVKLAAKTSTTTFHN